MLESTDESGGSELERLILVPSNSWPHSSTGWWGRYDRSLASSSLSPTAIKVIETDSRYVLESGILGAGPAGSPGWPASRHRSGMVMGAIQSGKTASMLGVTALALDAGVNIVVVLAGTRVALWQQTYERIVGQLSPSASDLVFPTPALMTRGPGASAGPTDLYQVPAARMRRALREGSSVVMVVMKHGQHLRAASRMLHERVYPQLSAIGRPAHLLVLDDEADDGSILDAVVETDLDPTQDAFKQIPRHIVDLWARRGDAPSTADPLLYASYVAYTATPQANFLQADQNPLAPRDFIAALRTPYQVGEIEPRSTTYREPRGLKSYYTGGEVFYRNLDSAAGLVVTQDQLPETDGDEDLAARRRWIAETVRAYLVAGAIRLWRDRPGRVLSGVRSQLFASLSDAQSACPAPHTMLFHPSSAVHDHFRATAELLAWGRGLTSAEAVEAVEAGCREFLPEVLIREMDDDAESWIVWLERYRASSSAVADMFGEEAFASIPDLDQWDEIREILEDEVIPNTRIAIVNSDPEADDRPEFAPQQVDGGWRAPRDIYTIFVSGNVMARGLTLEGLTTTLFLRTSGDPAADTQMQMQRWFGYRGPILELCRVFLPREQLSLFRQYHETDEGLRRQIVEAMNASGTQAPSPLVIEGARFRATGKIAGVSKVPLCPGANPFVDLVNEGLEVDPNLRLLSDVFDAPSSDVVVHGTLRGRILDEPIGLEDAAELLDRLRYGSYSPDPDDPTSTRWPALEGLLGVANDAASSSAPFFRPPPVSEGAPQRMVAPVRCPYNIAAYLRLWRACLDRRARGLFPTEDGERPWASLDLAQRRQLQPVFYVGIRYGSGEPITLPVTAGAPIAASAFEIAPMRRTVSAGFLGSTWGSRNPGDAPDAYLGDQLFDYHYHHTTPVPVASGEGPLWRPVGAPGQILFHVVSAEDRPEPVVAVGLGIPLGGPDHFAARARG